LFAGEEIVVGRGRSERGAGVDQVRQQRESSMESRHLFVRSE
jgi:hypothetical protein